MGKVSKKNLSGAKKLTPLMTQYWEQKSAHEDKILLFRMGDFFEMFHDDALTAAPILNIALTQRNKKSGDDTPMCGVPHHSIGEKINMLLSSGHKVAICDQIEDPKQAKGLVKRAVTRVLSPGVVFDPETLDAMSSNYLVSFSSEKIAFLETSTGEAFFYLINQKIPLIDDLSNFMGLLRPTELVLSEEQESMGDSLLECFPELVVSISPEKDSGEPEDRLVSYAKSLQGDQIEKTLAAFEKRELHSHMKLKQVTIDHLEIFESNRKSSQKSMNQK